MMHSSFRRALGWLTVTVALVAIAVLVAVAPSPSPVLAVCDIPTPPPRSTACDVIGPIPVVGQVVAGSGTPQPVEQARVRVLWQDQPCAAGTTAADGGFSLHCTAPIPCACLAVDIRAPGYAPWRDEQSARSGLTIRAHLTPASELPWPIYLPAAVVEGTLSGPPGTPASPTATATETPVDEPGTPPDPTPSSTSEATPIVPERTVAFQAATYGGLPQAPYFQDRIHRAPWITIYSDGTYIRAIDVEDEQLVRNAPVIGRLTAPELVAALDRLEHDGGFFAYPSEDRFARCFTDGSDTYAYLARGNREHRVASYLMLWLGLYSDVCPPGSRGWPEGYDTERFFALASQVASFAGSLSEGEEPYRVEHATIFVVPSTREGPAEWPLSSPIADAGGTDRLSPGEYAILLAAIQESRSNVRDHHAVFTDGDQTAEVGVRVEVPGWLSYCEGSSWCAP